MITEAFERKLTAILGPDVKGYRLLMRADEDETVRMLTAYRRAIGRLVVKYRGGVVDSPGDNLLAEFGSGLDAANSVRWRFRRNSGSETTSCLKAAGWSFASVSTLET